MARKRELIDTGTDKRYVRRNKLGTSWPRIGGSVPRPRLNPARATKATGRGQSAKPPAKAARNQPAGKAPLGSLPGKKGRSAAASSLPDFIPFATCLLVDRPPNGPDWVHEIKLDGWRIQISCSHPIDLYQSNRQTSLPSRSPRME